MKTISTVVIIAILMILSASCESEKIVERKHAWSVDENFLYDLKIQLNSYPGEDALYLTGPGTFSTITSSDDSAEFFVSHALIGHNYEINFKLPVSGSIFVKYNTNGIGFYSSRNPVISGTNKWIYIPAMDSSFADFCFPGYWLSEAIVINDQNQCLIPYEYFTIVSPYGRVVELESRFIMADLDVKNLRPGEEDYIDTMGCHRIVFDQMVGHPICLNSFKDYFIVTGDYNTVKISSDRTVTRINENRLYKIFAQNNILYAFTDSELLKSADEGLTWDPVCQSDFTFTTFGYSVIRNKVIGYRYNQLFEFTFDEQGFNVREFITDGLDGNLITSVNYFKGKVFVTTMSGVFSRGIDEFFDYVEESLSNVKFTTSPVI